MAMKPKKLKLDENIKLRLPRVMKERLEQIAEELGVPMSNVLRNIVRQYVASQPPAQPLKRRAA